MLLKKYSDSQFCWKNILILMEGKKNQSFFVVLLFNYKRRYKMYCTWRGSWITIIRYAQHRKIGKPNIYIFFSNKSAKARGRRTLGLVIHVITLIRTEKGYRLATKQGILLGADLLLKNIYIFGFPFLYISINVDFECVWY
jgi:hypothetical protein